MSSYNEQQLEAINSNERTILCLAGAGAGKTSTLIGRIARLVKDGVDPKSILALTFTNAAAFEMKHRFEKIPGLDYSRGVPEFRTFHGFCYSLIVKDLDVRSRLGYTKIPEICDDNHMKEIKTLVKLKIGCKLSDSQLEDDKLLSKAQQEEKKLFQKALIKEIKKENVITFDIMCYNVCDLFVKNEACIQKYKNQYTHIICDEMQDTDPKQARFLASFPATANFFLVGDILQCQPAGTLISMCDGTAKPIENIEVGDQVITYSPREGRFNASTKKGVGRTVTQVAKRFADNIVEVSTGNHSSRYTKDHITYCKIHYEGNEDFQCIYLMCNSEKGWWRIGKTHLFLYDGDDFGPRLRLKSEGGDKVWILDICSPNFGDAWLAEQTAAFKFGIPDTTWEFANCESAQYTEEALDALYKTIPDIEERAIKCLEYFDRDIKYPFYDVKLDTNKHFSKLHLFETRVGNLIPKLMDVVVPELFVNSIDKYNRKSLHNSYEQIISVTPCNPDWVYSLDVDKWHNYIADGILTHNCIYQFRGTSNEFIKQLSSDPNWKIIKMYENYRSTTNICNFANKFSTYSKDKYRIEMHGQRDGEDPEVIYGSHTTYKCPVDRDHLSMLIDKINASNEECAVLCRTNKECAAVRSALTDAGIKFSSRAKETDNLHLLDSALDNTYMLEWLSTKLEAKDYSDYIRLSTIVENPDIHWFLNLYGSNPAIRSAAEKVIAIRNAILNAESAKDKFESVTKLLRVKTKCTFNGDDSWTNKQIMEDVRQQVHDLEECPVYVGTIHSVKGLEYDTVYLMGVNDTMFKLGSEEMNNLYYVGMTRAKNRLVIFRR